MSVARQVQARLFPQRLPSSRTLEYAYDDACIAGLARAPQVQGAVVGDEALDLDEAHGGRQQHERPPVVDREAAPLAWFVRRHRLALAADIPAAIYFAGRQGNVFSCTQRVR